MHINKVNTVKKTAVILCGGTGSRLRPYTLVIPKPLMPVGNYSILEIIIHQLKKYEFDEIIMAVNYRSDMIRAFFQDGSKFGISIRYIEEKEPLGTIGPLRNIENLPENFLILNGDILTDLNFSDLLKIQQQSDSFGTISLYQRSHKVDFGVFKLNEREALEGFLEKPVYHFQVSMGVYAFNRKILSYIPKEGPFGFDDLMAIILEKKLFINFFKHEGYWLDIGRHEDYARAQDEWEAIEQTVLPK